MNQEFILNRKVVFYSTSGAAELREIGEGGQKWAKKHFFASLLGRGVTSEEQEVVCFK